MTKKKEHSKLDAFDFKIEMDSTSWQNDIKNALSIDRTDLDAEFESQPINFAYYAYLHELAKDLVNQCKRELELIEAHADHEARMEAKRVQAQSPKEKFTEKMIAGMVRTNKDFQAKELELLKYKKMAGVLGAVKEGLAQKKESLISMGANYRASSTPDMRIYADAAKHRTTERKEGSLLAQMRNNEEKE